MNVAWSAEGLGYRAEVDVVAFLVDGDERIIADEAFVFYNSPVSEHGAAALSVDGDCGQSVRIDLALVEDHHAKIVVGAALAGGSRFGDLGAVTVSIDGGLVTAATATLDAATTERTMLLAEIYRRNRLTAIARHRAGLWRRHRRTRHPVRRRDRKVLIDLSAPRYCSRCLGERSA